MNRSAIACAILFALPPSVLAQTEGDAPRKSRAANRITISKETTFYVEPLTPSGRVDYCRAINRETSAGVTVQNNAFVLLLPVLDERNVHATLRKKLMDELGIDQQPEGSQRLIDLWPFMESRGALGSLLGNKDVYDDLLELTSRMWKQADHPEIFAWIQRNESSLRMVVEASQRSRFYAPLVREDEKEIVYSSLLGHIQAMRVAGRALAARATLNFGEGNWDEGLEDIHAINRLSAMLCQGPTLMESLVGLSLHELACDAMRAAVASDALVLMSGQWEEAIEKWGSCERMVSLSKIIDQCERGMVLDLMGHLAAYKDTTVLHYLSGEYTAGDEYGLGVLVRVNPDWNQTLRIVNEAYDEIALAVVIDGCEQRENAIREITQRLTSHRGELSDWKWILKVSGERKSSEAIAQVFLEQPAKWLEQVSNAETRHLNQHRVVLVGLAIRQYRQRTGRFPETLQDLTSIIAERDLDDLITGEAFIYRPRNDGFVLYSVGRNKIDQSQDGLSSSSRIDDWGIDFPSDR